MWSVNKKSVMVLGTYKHSKMVALPNDEMIRMPRASENQVFLNNLASYFTNGNCTILLNCYAAIFGYRSLLRKQNFIFGVASSFAEFDNLVNLIEKHNWHFLIGKTNPNEINIPMWQKLMNLYGICMGYSTGVTQLDYEGNSCSNVTNDKISVCN